MPVIRRRRRVGVRRVVRRRRVGGSFKSFFRGVGRFFTGTKLISKLAPMIPGVGNAIGAVSGAVGLGRRRRVRRVRRVRRGGSMLSAIRGFLGRAHSVIKSHRYVSRALNHHGYNRAGSIAHILGYGRRRTVRRRRAPLRRAPLRRAPLRRRPRLTVRRRRIVRRR